MDEAAGVEAGRGEGLGRPRSVNDQQTRRVLPDRGDQRVQHAVQAVVLQRAEQAEVGETVADQGRIDKAEAAQVSQHPVVRLGQERRDEARPPAAAWAKARWLPSVVLPVPGSPVTR